MVTQAQLKQIFESVLYSEPLLPENSKLEILSILLEYFKVCTETLIELHSKARTLLSINVPKQSILTELMLLQTSLSTTLKTSLCKLDALKSISRKLSDSVAVSNSPNWGPVQSANQFTWNFDQDDYPFDKIDHREARTKEGNLSARLRPNEEVYNPFDVDDDDERGFSIKPPFRNNNSTAMNSNHNGLSVTISTQPGKTLEQNFDFNPFSSGEIKEIRERLDSNKDINSQRTMINIHDGPSLKIDVSKPGVNMQSFSEKVAANLKSLRLIEGIPLGDSNVEANFNYCLVRLSDNEIILTGHEQSLSVTALNGSAKVIKHGIPLLFNFIKAPLFEIYFSRNDPVVIKSFCGSKKIVLKDKFKPTYLAGKADNRSRSAQMVGKSLYFLNAESRLVLYNTETVLSSHERTSIEPQILSSAIEDFYVDSNQTIWTLSSAGVLTNLSLQRSAVLKNQDPKDPYPFTSLGKSSNNLLSTAYHQQFKQVILYLTTFEPVLVHSHTMHSQTSQVHLIKSVNYEYHSLFILQTLYTINLCAAIDSKIHPVHMDISPSENLLNSIDFHESSKTLLVADTRRKIKYFKLQ